MSCVHLIYFSPTYSTLKILQAIGRGTGAPVKEWDMSLQSLTTQQFGVHDLLVFGVPVFGGRVPLPVETRIKNFQGSNSPAVAVVVYGNRDYDDALLELGDLVKECGCSLISAGAFVAQHSLCGDFATGRPDNADLNMAEEYGKRIMQKVEAGIAPEATLPIKGNRPYKERKPAAAHPTASDACTECGTCAELCPVGAIAPDNLHGVDTATCILCARCIAVCPEKARDFPAPFRAGIKNFLTPLCVEDKKPECIF